MGFHPVQQETLSGSLTGLRSSLSSNPPGFWKSGHVLVIMGEFGRQKTARKGGGESLECVSNLEGESRGKTGGGDGLYSAVNPSSLGAALLVLSTESWEQGPEAVPGAAQQRGRKSDKQANWDGHRMWIGAVLRLQPLLPLLYRGSRHQLRTRACRPLFVNGAGRVHSSDYLIPPCYSSGV